MERQSLKMEEMERETLRRLTMVLTAGSFIRPLMHFSRERR